MITQVEKYQLLGNLNNKMGISRLELSTTLFKEYGQHFG